MCARITERFREAGCRLAVQATALSLAVVLASTAAATELIFEVGASDRRAILVNDAPPGQTRPVVLVLHGGRGSAEEQRSRTGFSAAAQGSTLWLSAKASPWCLLRACPTGHAARTLGTPVT